MQSLLFKHAGSAPTLAVSVNVCAFNIGIATGSMAGGAMVAAGGLRWLGLAAAALGLGALALTYVTEGLFGQRSDLNFGTRSLITEAGRHE